MHGLDDFEVVGEADAEHLVVFDWCRLSISGTLVIPALPSESENDPNRVKCVLWVPEKMVPGKMVPEKMTPKKNGTGKK